MGKPLLWSSIGQVNASDTVAGGYDQTNSKVVGLSNGGFVVVWEDYADRTMLGAPDIIGQLYDPLGRPVGGERLLSGIYLDSGQTAPDLAAFSDGDFLSAYQSTDAAGAGDLENVTAERYSSTASFQSFNDFRGPANDRAPSVATFADDSYALVYQDDQSGTDDLRLVFVDPAGVAAVGVVIEQTVPAGSPDIAALASGNIAVVFETAGDIALRIVTKAGASVAASAVTNAAGTQDDAVVATLSSGFVVAWADGAGDIKFSIYNDAGLRGVGPRGGNVTTTAGLQEAPAVVGLDDGGFMIAWRDVASGDIQGQRFDKNGVADGGESTLLQGVDCFAPQLAILADGRFVVSADDLASNGARDVISAIWDPRSGPISGTAGDDVLTAMVAGSAVSGLGGRDALYGVAGRDVLKGGEGADTLSGGEGADQLFGGLGADQLNGGGGVDYARYDDANYGNLTISLANAAQNTGAAAGDTYVSVEGVWAGAGNDTIKGDGGANVLVGQGGNDVLYGGLGADQFSGGDGIDYARYDDANYGNLTISLANPAQNTGAAAGDTYVGIEGVVGGVGNDKIGGNDFINYLYGGSGADTIGGNGGNDLLSGGSGADVFLFSKAPDAVSNMDRIVDFNVADDTIQLLKVAFTKLFQAGTLKAELFYEGSAAHDADDRIIYDRAAGRLFYDEDGTGAAAAKQFATVTAGLALTNADFVVA